MRRKTSKCNTFFPTTLQVATEPRHGQPHNPLPDFATEYFWTHRKYAHKGSTCNNKYLEHQNKSTFCNKRNGSTYGFT